MSHHPVGLAGRGALAMIQAMPPLEKRKNEYAAFTAGLLGGALGNGLYLRTWRDVRVAFVVNVGLTVATGGVGWLPSMLISGLYGFVRVRSSNAKLAALEETARLAAIEAKALPPAVAPAIDGREPVTIEFRKAA